MKTATKTVEAGAYIVTVREMTVADVRLWRNGLKDLADDLIGGALFDDIAIGELFHMSDLTEEISNALAPSQLRPVIDAAKELNQDFFAMRGRLMDLVTASRSAPSKEPLPK